MILQMTGIDPATAADLPFEVAAMVLLIGVVADYRRRPAQPPLPRLDDDHLLVLLAGLSAAVAHEIRNPLSSIKGHAQLLSRSSDGDIDLRAQRILEDVLRLERAVSGLIGLWDMRPWCPKATNPARVATKWATSTHYGPIRVDASASPGRWTLDGSRVAHALEFLARTVRAQSKCQEPLDLAVTAAEGYLVMTLGEAGGGDARADEHLSSRCGQPDIVHRSSFTMADHVARQHGGLASIVAENGEAPCFRLTFGRL